MIYDDQIRSALAEVGASLIEVTDGGHRCATRSQPDDLPRLERALGRLGWVHDPCRTRGPSGPDWWIMARNLTPHTIEIRTPYTDPMGHHGGPLVISIPSHGVARVDYAPGERVTMARTGGHGPWVEAADTIGLSSVPVYDLDWAGPVVGLPATDGIPIIVSAIVGAHPDVRDRRDVLVPGTGPADGAIRDDRGQIVAVTRLKRVGRRAV